MKNIVRNYISSIIFDKKTSIEKKTKILKKFFFKIWKISLNLKKIDYDSIWAKPMDEDYIESFIIDVIRTKPAEINEYLEKQCELIAWIIEKNEKQKIFDKYKF